MSSEIIGETMELIDVTFAADRLHWHLALARKEGRTGREKAKAWAEETQSAAAMAKLRSIMMFCTQILCCVLFTRFLFMSLNYYRRDAKDFPCDDGERG